MGAQTVYAIFSWISGYAVIGALFALYFMIWGARHMDPGHERSGFFAKLVLLPGVVMFWPMLLLRTLTGAKFEG